MADLDPKATPSLAPSADPDVITGAGGGGTAAGNAGDDLEPQHRPDRPDR